ILAISSMPGFICSSIPARVILCPRQIRSLSGREKGYRMVACTKKVPREFRAFRNLHAGASILVCGCGPSLNELDNAVGLLTIGVNDVGRKFTPDYLVVVNPRSQFTADRLALIENCGARAVFSHLNDLRPKTAPLVRFRLGTYNGTDLSDAETLHYTQNSPYVAVCLAMHLGAQRIGLIGVDFVDHHVLSGKLPQIEVEYRKLAIAAQNRGIEIFNLGAASRLTALPKLSLAEF